MSIRTRMIVWTVLPLLVVASATIALNRGRLLAALEAATRAELVDRAEAAASGFDTLFERMAQTARSAAMFLEIAPDVTEEQIYALARRNTEQDAMTYGSCIAFAPGAFGGRERFAPYVCRDGTGGFRAMELSTAYDYASGEWEWFREPAARGEEWWTEPYFDEGAGNVEMCTFSAPFRREGRVAGVVTVDLPVAPLTERLRRVGSADLILSRMGRPIAATIALEHPGETIFERAEALGQPELADLGRAMVAGESGVRRLNIGPSGRPTLTAFAPIPAAGWSYVALQDEGEALGPARRQLRDSLLLVTGMIGLLVVALLATAVRITRPIRRLAAAVGMLSTGDLDAHVEGVEAKDEIGGLARAFNGMVGDLKAHVDALTRATKAREAVESELRVARGIQESLLPMTFPPFPERAEFDLHALNVPARRIAGDFYDFFFVGDGRLAVIVADVSGKGVPAALLMAVSRTLLRNLLMEGRSPAAAMSRANELIVADNSRGMFVTMFVGLYETASGRLEFCNGGHPPPLVVDARGAVRDLGQPTGPLVGVVPDGEYADAAITLAPGEALFSFSDGVTEARAPDGKLFGDERLAALVGRVGAGAGARGLCEGVAREIEQYQEGVLADDLTMLALKRNV